MKEKIFSALMLLASTIMLCCCSDDNDSQPVYEQKYPSLVTEFLETYGFRTLETIDENGNNSVKGTIVPVEGVLSYKIYYNKKDGVNLLETIREGKAYNVKNNSRHFNKLLEKYGDTHFDESNRSNFIDSLPYRPHPYAITRIDMQLEDKFTSKPTDISPYLPPHETWMPDYNDNYPCGSKCNSLFKIRYRTYYDYIKNGYTWEGSSAKSQWKDMELTEFNQRGGDKLIDMSRIFLIVKERPNIYPGQQWPLAMTITFENGKTNKRNSDLRVGMRIYPSWWPGVEDKSKK